MLWCYLKSSLFHTRPEITTQTDLRALTPTILWYWGCTLTYSISHTDFTLCEMFTHAWAHSPGSFPSAMVPSKIASTTGREKVVQRWKQCLRILLIPSKDMKTMHQHRQKSSEKSWTLTEKNILKKKSLEIKAIFWTFWRTLIWELFVSSENFSFKGLSLSLFKRSKKTSPPVVSSCYWLAQPLSFWGVAPKAQLGWQCEDMTAHGFPNHRAVSGNTTGSDKRATSVQACDRRNKYHISPTIKNCFWSILYFI